MRGALPAWTPPVLEHAAVEWAAWARARPEPRPAGAEQAVLERGRAVLPALWAALVGRASPRRARGGCARRVPGAAGGDGRGAGDRGRA